MGRAPRAHLYPSQSLRCSTSGGLRARSPATPETASRHPGRRGRRRTRMRRPHHERLNPNPVPRFQVGPTHLVRAEHTPSRRHVSAFLSRTRESAPPVRAGRGARPPRDTCRASRPGRYGVRQGFGTMGRQQWTLRSPEPTGPRFAQSGHRARRASSVRATRRRPPGTSHPSCPSTSRPGRASGDPPRRPARWPVPSSARRPRPAPSPRHEGSCGA